VVMTSADSNPARSKSALSRSLSVRGLGDHGPPDDGDTG
jgi:hypothetical protein